MAVHVENRSDLRDSARRAAAKVAQDVSRVTEEAMEDALITLRHSAKDFADSAAVQSKFATRAVRKSVREHPVTWVSASAGLGLLLGALLMRRPPIH